MGALATTTVKAVSASLRALSWVSVRLAGGAAWKLFGRPGRISVHTAEREVHLEAKANTLVVNGQKVAVYRWGDGPSPVLMLHGWGGRGSNFAAFVPELLLRRLTPIAFDAPAHGHSSGRSTDLLECAEIIGHVEERYGPFDAVIAHSFGALSAFHAMRCGIRMKRIVTINGVCEISYLIDHFAELFNLPSDVRHDLRRRMEKHFAPEPDIWQRFSVPYNASSIEPSVLVIQDLDDQTVQFEQARKIVQAYAPRSTLITTTGLGHRKAMRSATVIKAAVEFVADGTPFRRQQ